MKTVSQVVNPSQAKTIDFIYKNEFKKKCAEAPIEAKDKCAFDLFINPMEGDSNVYVRLKWAEYNEDLFIITKEAYTVVSSDGVSQTLKEKYPSWGLEQQVTLISKLQKLKWE